MLLSEPMACVNRAKAIIELNDGHSLRYAALEIRMAIEILFYKLIPLYKDELPDDVHTRWQPRQVIDAVLDCDPNAQLDHTISYAEELPNDQLGDRRFLGTSKGVKRELLREYWHKLGSYLHASMEGKKLDNEKLELLLLSAVKRLEDHCKKTTISSNMGNYYHVQCNCGRIIKRNQLATVINRTIKCPNSQCGALFDLTESNAKGGIWQLREHEILCQKCGTINEMQAHLLFDGASFSCLYCNHKYIFNNNFVMRDHPDNPRVVPLEWTI